MVSAFFSNLLTCLITSCVHRLYFRSNLNKWCSLAFSLRACSSIKMNFNPGHIVLLLSAVHHACWKQLADALEHSSAWSYRNTKNVPTWGRKLKYFWHCHLLLTVQIFPYTGIYVHFEWSSRGRLLKWFHWDANSIKKNKYWKIYESRSFFQCMRIWYRCDGNWLTDPACQTAKKW